MNKGNTGEGYPCVGGKEEEHSQKEGTKDAAACPTLSP
jgi:hypothetical protein